ncbi:MAG: ATP-binding protein [Xanthomonadales bacterium]|nr:ATP-binding protein [Xanthomonadales bacterium]
MKIDRPDLVAQLERRLKTSPAVALLGPRQCGKTTLARWFAGRTPTTYFDLENPADLSALSEPMRALSKLRGLVVIDEIQRRPDLFPVLRVLLDRRPVRTRFLILGSAAPELLRQSSETLAGRIALIDMSGFSTAEVGARNIDKLWLRGGFPRSYLARTQQVSGEWREDFIRTFLERDLPQLGIRMPAPMMRRFWTMVAHHSGGIWNASSIGNSLGESHPAARRHLDVLSGALVVRVLQPWFENLSKRQIKAPKVYVRDSGLLHTLLGIRSSLDLDRHPKLGASWEGFVIEQVLTQVRPAEAYYWRTRAGAELDLLIMHRGKRIGMEVKYGDAPMLTPSMRSAFADLKLARMLVIYPGERRYRLADHIEVMSLDAAVAEVMR